MHRLAPAALIVAFTLASCSGAHSGGTYMPGPATASGTGPTTTATTRGTRTTRALAQAAAPAGWATTGTQVLSLLGGSDLGVLSGTQTLTIRVGLQLQNPSALQAAARSGQILSPSQVAADGPTASQVSQVTAYLQSKGFTNVSVEPNNLIVSANATAAQASAAFDTTLHRFSVDGATVFANTTPAYVPQALGSIVVAVLGLNDVQMFKTPQHVGSAHAAPAGTLAAASSTPTPQPESPCSLGSVEIVGLPSPEPEPSPVAADAGCARNYTPSDFWRAYDANVTPAASNVLVAIMAEGNVQQSVEDFQTNEQGDGLVHVPVVVKPVGLASTDTSGDDEWTLDLTASTGMARAVKGVYLYDTTSLTDSDIALEYNRWVTDDLTKIGNSSFGGCEFGPYLDGSMLLDDEILLEGAAQGQTMFASTGDTGAFCSVGTPNGVPAGAPLVEYPAASPYTVAVGGTTLLTQVAGNYQGEAAWYSGGGGLSQFEYSPYWEASAQPVASAGAVSMRGLPDVAMDADLQTGMVLYLSDEGGWTVIGGTSLASPLAAGTWARMLQQKRSLGFAAPVLYEAWSVATNGVSLVGPPPTTPRGGFHDILTGANGAYTAAPGYDYTSGLGSVDVDAMSAALGT
ncbi:MAG TPA: S53 family peptidase [Candidatus Sulfotelmatobacter sp.]|nr:S53 family peptidase [Candidatus Sulfotelmatobacter sp.]